MRRLALRLNWVILTLTRAGRPGPALMVPCLVVRKSGRSPSQPAPEPLGNPALLQANCPIDILWAFGFVSEFYDVTFVGQWYDAE